MKYLYLPLVFLIAVLYTNEYSEKNKDQLALDKVKTQIARAPGSKSAEPSSDGCVDKWKKYFKFN